MGPSLQGPYIMTFSTGSLYHDFALPDAVVAASESGIDVALSSNGSRFTRDIADRIMPHLKWVRISVLAASESVYTQLHGTSAKTWQAVFNNLASMAEVVEQKNLSTVLGIQTCLLPENGDDIVSLASTVKQMGFKYISDQADNYICTEQNKCNSSCHGHRSLHVSCYSQYRA